MRKLAKICSRLERIVGGRYVVVEGRNISGKRIYSVHWQTGHLPIGCICEDNVREFFTLRSVEQFLNSFFL